METLVGPNSLSLALKIRFNDKIFTLIRTLGIFTDLVAPLVSFLRESTPSIATSNGPTRQHSKEECIPIQ